MFISILRRPLFAVALVLFVCPMLRHALAEYFQAGKICLEWQKAAAGTSTFVDIPEADRASYTTPLLESEDSGEQDRWIISGMLGNQSSGEAVLTFAKDTLKTTVVSARTLGNPNKVTVVFSKPVQDAAPSNFAINNGVIVTGIVQAPQSDVLELITTTITADKTYTLTLNGIRDLAGNEIAANTPIPIDLFVEAPGEVGQMVNGFQDDFSSATRNTNWVVVPAEADFYEQTNGVLRINTKGLDPNPNHLLYEAAGYSRAAQEVLARIRVKSLAPGGSAIAGLAVGIDPKAAHPGEGINLVFISGFSDTPGQEIRLVDDWRVWGPAVPGFIWESNAWYWVRLRQSGSSTAVGANLHAKVWRADGIEPEPADWQVEWAREGRVGFAGIRGPHWKAAAEFEFDYILIKAAGLPSIKVAPSAFALVGPPLPPPRLTAVIEANNVVLTWTGGGALESAESVTGPWTNVAGAISPRTVAVSVRSQFFRLREGPETMTFSNGQLNLVIQKAERYGQSEFWLDEVQMQMPSGWQTILRGTDGQEFSTSFGSANATRLELVKSDSTGMVLRLSGQRAAWEAEELIELAASATMLQRKQTYHFPKAGQGAVYPGFRVKADSDIRYTYPMWAHEQPLAGINPLRRPVDWAVPLPFHVWHNQKYVALYGLDKSASAGTIDFLPVTADGYARLRVYYPDSYPPDIPGTVSFAAGSSLTLTEIIAVKPLAAGDDPLLEAERIAASILLRKPAHPADLVSVASGIADYFRNCGLWEPNALGSGLGWFRNMWVHTASGIGAAKDSAFDLGWGEGEIIYMWIGAVRHWQRTGDTNLLQYVDKMAGNMRLFKRGAGTNTPYFDRSRSGQFGDFGMRNLIWTHSVGHIGSQVIQLYQAAPDYPNAETRKQWLAAATAIANFLAQYQKTDGDLQDTFDSNNQEVNHQPHRCAARAVVCGLWTRLGQVTGEPVWIDRALRLAKAVGPEIKRYEFFNQMMDHCLGQPPSAECTDGMGAYYALEGLVPLYAATHDPAVLSLCQAAAAYGILWTYFYDIPIPRTHNGIARGGQCCCNHYPLIYVIGPAIGMEPLLSLFALTGDSLYEQLAAEMVSYMGNSQIQAPGKPWHGGMIHAFGQNCGKYWGPDLDGQVDTGMSSGNSLAAIEVWLARRAQSGADQGATR